VIAWLTYTIITASLLLAAWLGFSSFRGHPMYVPHLVGLGIVQLLVIGQAVVSGVLMVQGERPEQFAVFLGYLATVVLIPLAAALWGLMERSRWGPAVIAAALVVLPALMVRLQDTWGVTGG
jgi:hypothetical protein